MKDVEVIKAHNTLSPRARTNFEKRLRVAPIVVSALIPKIS